MYCFYHKNTRIRRLFTLIYSSDHTHNMGPTWRQSQDGWQPVQPAAMRNKIYLVWNEQVGCYTCQFDLNITIYSSGLPTSFWYLLPQDFPRCFVIIISSLPLQQIMAQQTPQQVEYGTELSRTMGASSNVPLAETQLQRRHHLAHCKAASAATEYMTLDGQLRIVCKTGSSKNKKQLAIGCEYN